MTLSSSPSSPLFEAFEFLPFLSPAAQLKSPGLRRGFLVAGFVFHS